MSDAREDVAAVVKPCEWCADRKFRDVLHRGTGDLHRVSCACQHELPVSFVYQPETNGCGVAVVAMVAGKSYFDVKQYINVQHDFECNGMDVYVLDALLNRLGFLAETRHLHDSLLRTERAEWPCKPWTDLAICQVRNTRDSGWHYVVLLRDGRVLDPYWGVLQGLHRYPRVASIIGVHAMRQGEQT